MRITKEKKKGEKRIEEGNLFSIFTHPLMQEDVDEILERQVVKIGNGAHINIPLKHVGKRAKITIFKKEKQEGEK